MRLKLTTGHYFLTLVFHWLVFHTGFTKEITLPTKEKVTKSPLRAIMLAIKSQ